MIEHRDTVARILAHLGMGALALGCRGEGAPSHTPAPVETVNVGAAPPPSAGAPSAAPTAPSASPVASAAPPSAPTATAPVAPAPVASASRAKKVGGRGQPCGPNFTCDPPLDCERPFNGAGFGPGPGTCVTNHVIYEGRPLVVDGVPRTATTASRGDGWSEAGTPLGDLDPAERSRLREELAAAAFEEHASIAAFARTACELMALGAPAWLLAKTSQAMGDEIAHARAAFALAARLDGAVEPGPFSAAVSPLRAGPDLARELFVDVLRGGCIGETLAAHRAGERAEAASSSHLRAFYTMIATDEARHAALALETARWLLEGRPELRAVLEEETGALTGEARTLVLPLLEACLGAKGAAAA